MMTGMQTAHRHRIVLDCRWRQNQASGIAVYTEALARTLPAADPGSEYRFLYHLQELAETHPRPASATAGDSIWLVPWGPYSLVGQLLLPALLSRHADVYHSPNYLIPLAAFPRGRPGRIGCVTTIHDLIPLKLPDHAPRARKARFLWLYRWLVREAVLRSDAVICPSHATQRDLIELLGLPHSEAKIFVIPEAPAATLRPAPERRSEDPLILFVGRRDPYKNLPLLIEAFAILRNRLPQAHLEVIGPPDPRYPEAEELARRLGVWDAIAWRGYAAHDVLAEAYQRAHVFALPSRYEGFGLPVLEAMACGCPVVCSRAGSLPEIAGEAASYVDPLTAENLAAALHQVLTQADFARRLSQAGLKRAGAFSWEKTARETAALYREVAEQVRRRQAQ